MWLLARGASLMQAWADAAKGAAHLVAQPARSMLGVNTNRQAY